MRPRGRRHWTETITVQTITHITSGPNTGDTTATTLHEDITASVQPASNADAIRHGLDTDQPIFWVRFAESPPKKGDRVLWRDESYVVVEVSEASGVDTELLVRLDGSVPS